MPSEPICATTLTVSAYAARLGSALRSVGGAVIEGEVQKVTRTGGGMLFFDLTDGEARLTAKVFPRDVAGLEHRPAAGDLVEVRVDRPDFYAAQGSVSLVVSAVRLAGEGELLRRRAELLARLRAEGLCDPQRRRRLPAFPRAVGVIAGASSDGMSDVIRALTDRWPAVAIVACPSPVQGKAAPAALIDALARLQSHPAVDVIVMARGGGSVQDLACFDDERLCRALSACLVPVVCAIGHTDNTPVCNEVAWAAYTPSRSAELAVPCARELRREIAVARGRLDTVPDRIARAAERLAHRGAAIDPHGPLATVATEVAARIARAGAALDAHLNGRRDRLTRADARLLAVPHRAVAQLGHARGDLMAAGTGIARTGVTLTRQTEAIERLGARLAEGTRRRLEAATVAVTHRAELVGALDFRPRGWLLASRADGTPIRGVGDLTPRSHLRLDLHDGAADVLVEAITPDPRSD